MVKVVLNFHLGADVRIPVPDDLLARLAARFPQATFVAANDRDTLAREVSDAEIFCGFVLPDELVPGARRLRWIQSISAGIEGALTPALRDRDILLTNGAGIAAVSIAEHVLALMLALSRHLHVALRLQAEARWDRTAVMFGTGEPLRELAGSRVAVLGLGPIGRAVAERAGALGAVVRGLRRHPPASAPPAPFETIVGLDGLAALLAWADFVVVAVPHTPETERMLGARELALIRPDAYLVNIARGSVIDESALADALRRRALAGAGLDVFETEPLPASSPLWGLPNVLITPHSAGATPHYFNRAAALFMDNLDRYLAGRPLQNLVDKALGYPKQSA